MRQNDKVYVIVKRFWGQLIMVTVGIVLVACTPTITRPVDAEPAQPVMDTPTAEAMEEEESMAETPESEPVDAAAPVNEPLIVQQVKADLAERLSIDTSQIEVVEVRDVAWRDGSLGCPQPDMMYTQVIISGMKVILSVDGEEYHYHSGGNREPFYCENPDPDGGIG